MKAKTCQISQITAILLGLLLLCSEVYAELPGAVSFTENESDVSETSEPASVSLFGAGLLSLGKVIRKQQNTTQAASLNNLALLYKSQGRYEEAEPLYRHALAINEKKLGPEHPYVAAALNNLALLYKFQGRYEEAEPLYTRALAINEKKLGQEHPHVAASLNNLALLYSAQGRYEEAEPLHRRASAIREKLFSHNHLRTAAVRNNLNNLPDTSEP